MMKVVSDAKDASAKKRRLTNLEDADDESGHSFSSSKNIFKNKSTGEGVQATLNQMYKKGDKEKVDAQVAEFFYTSAIPFNVIRNPAFIKMCDMIARYGVGYKPPSYHDIREKLLK